MFDASFVFILDETGVHRFCCEELDGGNYSYYGKFGEYGIYEDENDYQPPHYFKKLHELDVVISEDESESRMAIADTGNDNVRVASSFWAEETYVLVTDKTKLGLNKPRGVSIVSLDTVYIADTGNDRILKVEDIDTNNPVIEEEWHCSDIGDGFDEPKRIIVDNSGNIYVTEWGELSDDDGARIFKYDGSSWSFFEEGGDIAVDSDNNVYIEYNPYIHIYDSNGDHLAQIDTGAGYIKNVDSAGNIFVYHSYSNQRFIKYSPVD